MKPNGPAQAAGVTVGDRVVAIDGAPVEPLDAGGVEALIANHPPGSKLRFGVLRGAVRKDLVAVIGARQP